MLYNLAVGDDGGARGDSSALNTKGCRRRGELDLDRRYVPSRHYSGPSRKSWRRMTRTPGSAVRDPRARAKVP